MASRGSVWLRRRFQRTFDLTLRPLSDLAEDEAGAGLWRATGENPRFALELSGSPWPSGWVLLESRLDCHSPDRSARLCLDMGAGFSEKGELDMPLNKKGAIQELVRLPRGLAGMQWVPLHSPGTFRQSAFSMRRVGFAARVYRMLRRVVPALWNQPRAKLDALGLGLSRMLFDLKGAYAASGKLRAYTAAPSYAEWIARTGTLSGRDRRRIERRVAQLAAAPRFVLLVAAGEDDDEEVARTLGSIHRQLYRHVEVRVVTQRESGSWSSGLAAHDYIGLIRAGDVLENYALYWMASVIESSPEARLLYSDEDRIDANGTRCDPIFKPGWSPELLRSTNYLDQLAVFRSDELARAGGLKPADFFGGGHDLMLRICERLAAEHIVHVPAILVHRGAMASPSDGTEAVAAHLSRCGIPASVSELAPGAYRVRYALPQALPMVSILVPTRDAFDLLRQCVESILQKSTYPNYEIVVIDNQTSDAKALEYLSRLDATPRVRVLRYDLPFNYSAINNFAARQARGDVLCLLNNDTEVITAGWMEEMLGHLVQNRVGVVGAKLLYPDGRVQHAGDAVGVGGVANHLHAFIGRDSPGYCNRAILAQDLSAVTAACMMTWRKLFMELGGLDEAHLKVNFNDVDYCLRVRKAGYRVTWTPHAELYHYESVSRGSDDTPEKKARARAEAKCMRTRWRRELRHDPFYNPNLSYERADFSLSHAPLVKRPWNRLRWPGIPR